MSARKSNSENGAGGDYEEGGQTNVAESETDRTVHVGKYTLHETIGEGAFGKVKVAVDEVLGSNFAVKILDKARIEKADSTVQVRREINILRAMRHPHIVNLHEVLNSSKKLYMVMDLVTGGGLFDTVSAETRLSESTARMYFQQLVDGIAYCHSRSVYHRDLKPENLLLSGDKKTLKIADFGTTVSRPRSDKGGLMPTLTGSPNFMAPELLASEGSNGCDGAKVDVWACGVILYAMLAGYLPYPATNPKELHRTIIHSTVTFPKHFSYDVIKLLRAMLHKDPAKRATTEEVKTFAWFKVGYEPTIIPQQTSSLAPAPRHSPPEFSQSPLLINKQASKDRMSRKIRRKLLGNSNKLSSSITSSHSDSLQEPEDENERPSVGALVAKRRKSSNVKRASKVEQMIAERANSALAAMSSSRSLTPLSIARSENDDIATTLSDKKITTDLPSRQEQPPEDDALPHSFTHLRHGNATFSPMSAIVRAATATTKTQSVEVVDQAREKALPSPDIITRAGSSDGGIAPIRRTSAADGDVPPKLVYLRRLHERRHDGPTSATSSILPSSQMNSLAPDPQPAVRQPSGFDPSADTILDNSNRSRAHRLIPGNFFGRVTSRASDDHEHDTAKPGFRPRIPSFGPARSNSRSQAFARLPSQSLHGEVASTQAEDEDASKTFQQRADLWASPPLSPGRILHRTSSSLLYSPFHQEADHANQYKGQSGVPSPKEISTTERMHLELHGMLDILKATTRGTTPKPVREKGGAQGLNISIVNGLASLDQPLKSPRETKTGAFPDSPLTPPDVVGSHSFSTASDQTVSVLNPKSSIPLPGTEISPPTQQVLEVFKPVLNQFSTLTDGPSGEEYLEEMDFQSQPVGLPAYVLEELRKEDHDNGYPPWCALEIDVFEDRDESECNTQTFNPKRRQAEIAELLQKTPKAARNVQH